MAALAVALSVPCSAETPDDPPGFYERGEEGWFWYEPEPEPEPEPKPPEEPPAPKVTASEAEKTPEEGPQHFSAEWFRENLPKYKDAAWDDPTPENVRAYLYLQKLATDRSEVFANVSEFAVMGDPFLDESVRRPRASFGAENLDRLALQRARDLIQGLSNTVGLFFFFDSSCMGCMEQVPPLVSFARQHGITVIPISLDGKPMPNGAFPNFRVDQGQGEKMGIRSLPGIVAVSTTGEFETVSNSIIAQSQLQKRLLIASTKAGWISQDDFDSTLSVTNNQFNISDKIDLPDNVEDDYVPPEQLMDYIRRSINE